MIKTGTPDEVWFIISRCWRIDPSSDHIIEVIEGFPRVLDIIINYSGCIVPAMNFRSGERAESHDKKRVLKKDF